MVFLYKIGYILVVIWLMWLTYGYLSYDEVNQSGEMSLVVFATGLGILVFPVYFFTIYFFRTLIEKLVK